MSEIVRANSSGSSLSPIQQRQLQRTMAADEAQILREVRRTGRRIEGAAALAGHAMQLAVALDHQRQALSASAPEVGAALLNMEMDFLAYAQSEQRNLYKNNWF